MSPVRGLIPPAPLPGHVPGFFIPKPMTATTYKPELAAKLCAAIAAGESGKDSLRSICKQPGMPSRATVYRWLDENPEFSEMYGKASARRADGYIDEIVEIADGAPGTKSGIAKAKLKIYAREKYAAKIAPRKYGDKITQELVGAGGGAIQVQTAAALTDDQLAAIAAGKPCS